MTTANLQILEEYAIDGNDYISFCEDLALWAHTWVAEIALPIAKASRELFENQAVRMLVTSWAQMKRKDDEYYRVAFQHAVDGDEVDADDLNSTYRNEVAAYSQALYLLLVK